MLIKNNIIPFKGFTAINLLGIVFVRREEWERMTSERKEKILRHEAIHTRQMVELLFIGFYALYLLEWCYWLVFRPMSAYRNISFEREAYDKERNKTYLETRRHFAQWRKVKEKPHK